MMKSNLVLRGLVGTSTQTKPVNADFHIRPTPQLHAAFAYVAIARPAQHSSAAGQVNTARVKVHLSHCIVLCSQGLLEVLKFCNCFLVVRLPRIPLSCGRKISTTFPGCNLCLQCPFLLLVPYASAPSVTKRCANKGEAKRVSWPQGKGPQNHIILPSSRNVQFQLPAIASPRLFKERDFPHVQHRHASGEFSRIRGQPRPGMPDAWDACGPWQETSAPSTRKVSSRRNMAGHTQCTAWHTAKLRSCSALRTISTLAASVDSELRTLH